MCGIRRSEKENHSEELLGVGVKKGQQKID